MQLADFLHSINLSGTLQHTKEFPSKKETYYVIRLRNVRYGHKYIIIHEDHTRSARCSLSIQRYEYNLVDCTDYLDSLSDLQSISVDLHNN